MISSDARNNTPLAMSSALPGRPVGVRSSSTNDDTLSAEEVALGYKDGWIIESCFRRMKQTRLEVHPMLYWTSQRIEAHVLLCVLALQVQRAAEIHCSLPWSRIAHELARTATGDRGQIESNPGTERADIDSAMNLEQQIGAFSRPSHLLRFVRLPFHNGPCRQGLAPAADLCAPCNTRPQKTVINYRRNGQNIFGDFSYQVQ
jgi:hypothetical protein